MEENQTQENTKKNWHDRHYKKLLIIPGLIILFSVIYLIIFYSQTGDIIHKDISLLGGTSVTIYEKQDIDILNQDLGNKLPDLNIREVSDLVTGEQIAVIIETTLDGDSTRNILEDYFGYPLTEDNSSFEFSESSFTSDFYKQLIRAVLLAFALMAVVVFILFKNFTPSITVIACVFINIIMTVTAINLLGVKVSTGGIIAVLMLIGYSVDTDILLTNRVLKRHDGNLNEKIYGAFKTGITMTLVSLLAVVAALFVVKSFSAVLTQIFLIISIGLSFDLINTWITNVSIIKRYVLRNEKAK
jgi:preprotein translocase subunit SecF